MAYNVDVVCFDTGEVFKEGVTLTAAHDFIEEKGWVHKKTTCDEIEESSIDDAVPCYTLWVEVPETREEIRKMEENAKRTREFWQY
jgi:hypothetical protein